MSGTLGRVTDSPPPRKRYITPEGFRRIAEEHQAIWSVERPRIVAEVEAAAALGDRSENAEYLYGKRKLRELDRRLRQLSRRMDELSVVVPAPHPSGRAFFGAWVRVEEEDGRERVFRLVGPDEFDVARGLLSVDSPLGRALLGKRAGEVATVLRPSGPAEVGVLDVAWVGPGGDGVEPSSPSSARPPVPDITPSPLVPDNRPEPPRKRVRSPSRGPRGTGSPAKRPVGSRKGARR